VTIDVHAHVIPPALVEQAGRPGGLFGVVHRDGAMEHPEGFRAPLTADFHDAAAIVRRMDATGLRGTVLSLSPTLFFYELPAPEARSYAVTANDAIADLVAINGRLLGLAQLPMQDPDGAAAELERAVRERGLRGAQIGTNVGAASLDDRRFDIVFATAERLGVPLVLHPYFVGPKSRLEPYFLTNTIGNPLDTCVAAARLIHAGTLDRYPALRLVLVHGGGFLPYQLGRLDHAHHVRSEARTAIAEPPSRYLNRFWFDTITHGDAPLRLLEQVVGADRLVLGTDLPYDMADRHPLARAARAGLEGDALAANALALFGPAG
jgi:aminocarboxymuconate-semialdehyde decarboxylase